MMVLIVLEPRYLFIEEKGCERVESQICYAVACSMLVLSESR